MNNDKLVQLVKQFWIDESDSTKQRQQNLEELATQAFAAGAQMQRERDAAILRKLAEDEPDGNWMSAYYNAVNAIDYQVRP